MNANDIAVIVQCRLSSSRLPGKALKLLGGKPIIEWTLNSMKLVEAGSYWLAVDEDSYEGEIHYRGYTYEFEIDAYTGRITDWDVDRD